MSDGSPMAQVAIPSFSFRRRLGLQRRLAFLLLAQEAAASNRRFRGLQAATSTFTTTRTIDPCPSSTTACECAAGEICVWKPYSGGGGVCENVGTKGHIDCFLCAQQEHCATITCPGITTACACAAAAGCAWADAASGCVSSLLSSTSCTACPTQAGCDVDPPQLASYFPQRGGSHSSGSDLRVVLRFTENVRWCSGSSISSGVSFWCAGSVNEQSVPRTHMQISSRTLSIDMSWYLSTIQLESARTCGISIEPMTVCDEDAVPYAGLSREDYSFQLLDTNPPILIDFDPNSMSVAVPLDGAVNLLWSEPVLLASGDLTATLSRLEVDSTGTTTAVQSVPIVLKAPSAEILSSSLLRIHLDTLLRSGKTYTLELPEGAVRDMAGNPSAHLPAQAYNFRAATGTNVSGTPQQTTSSTAVGIVILIVSLTVFCTLAAGIGTIKLWRSHANKLKAYLPQEGAGRRKPAQSAPISIPVPETTKPAYDKSASASPFAEEKARAETAYRSAAAAAERLGKDAGSNSANSANSESKPASGATWAQRPGSKTGPSPSPKVHPGFNAGRNRRSTPPPAGEGSSGGNKAPASAPAPETNLSPEVKAVEKRLHDTMDQPIATRRKLFKELLVEYHPDKNSSAHAKEVFQYVNNARSWFLVET
ncbi:unnamed protein product [Symbiodinium natans]|uniref:SbsA Ig-like domain-containing protein n=1 Tax=Symbiodinium natans TaxID=878477 RepID=A0A812P628_9DINO|nr:unnamed protein product [Symbiodinium natans]